MHEEESSGGVNQQTSVWKDKAAPVGYIIQTLYPETYSSDFTSYTLESCEKQKVVPCTLFIMFHRRIMCGMEIKRLNKH